MELFDLYNADREKTGEVMERGKSIPDNRYHLVVHICIINSKGEMLIQRRQPFKLGWPGMWDLTCGGSAISGENSARAASRELEEEIGYKMSFNNIRPVFTIHFDHGFDDIYIVDKDVDMHNLVLQYEEVQAVKWATQEEIIDMIDRGIFIPYHKELIKLLFFMKNHRGTFVIDDLSENNRTEK